LKEHERAPPLGKIAVHRTCRFLELDESLVGQDKNVLYFFCSPVPEEEPAAACADKLQKECDEPKGSKMDSRIAPITRDDFHNLLIVIEEKAASSSRIGRKNGLEFGNILSVGHVKLALSRHRESVACFVKSARPSEATALRERTHAATLASFREFQAIFPRSAC
jgi:hypothetical protein